MKVVLEILFLSLSNADVKFAKLGRITCISYTAAEVLPTTSWVELIDKRQFTKAILDKNCETFIVHISALEATTIHPCRTAEMAAL